jgi:hypothetical protein
VTIPEHRDVALLRALQHLHDSFAPLHSADLLGVETDLLLEKRLRWGGVPWP